MGWNQKETAYASLVASRADVWIEMNLIYPALQHSTVASCESVWFEIFFKHVINTICDSRTLRGCVDWNREFKAIFVPTSSSYPTWMRGLKWTNNSIMFTCQSRSTRVRGLKYHTKNIFAIKEMSYSAQIWGLKWATSSRNRKANKMSEKIKVYEIKLKLYQFSQSTTSITPA